ncbi:NAD-dependent succinate-semialdehyde dehydrogenase [Rhodococcus erythropolis]|uniref:NAD-dependent succinate-semialdehyde dehydrogenase n=1 Tax=Rhodococcus erythropolis TaxID=1833 RepID=A0A8I0ZZE6_RHOER|nr:NAD-dependent succinate-semialdehyde dehydrogenase [Rhodococcus erythropolis]MBH5142010.1 NAD-dependent succinate-semialdehyde dehydrogenase [Rhodococcus erythropolis]MBH5145378.1 NAD-dependent succinate-semialdehyde dehydrogenase [Rhodococcus erythropolis]MBH5145382.1 NAD-dependent succinate-semialdehyde dehydrogenase [Rhodococcus erythropolis]
MTTALLSKLDDLVAGLPTKLLIGGRDADSAHRATFGVRNPATGETFIDVADATETDAVAALDAAAAAQQSWSATPARERSVILRRAWELVVGRGEELALLMSLEMGKPLAESRGEVAYGAEFLRWFSEEATRIHGRYTHAPAGNGRILVTKQAVGPVLAITPWNFPLAMATRKIAPALAAGCTMIVKPAEDTPLTLMVLGRIFVEAGLPEGVLSVLPTSNAAAISGVLMADARLRKVTFTGSTAVGKRLIAQSADLVLRTSMELGGNAPFIVFDDADIDDAVQGALAAKMRNGGQACTAANRILVANAVRAEFTAKLTEKISALAVGPGYEDGTRLGPLINERQLGVVAALVDDAVIQGATVLTGGHALGGAGYFYAPTVLTDIPSGARLLREEIFGPVAAITGFDTEDQAIASANDTEYGLAAYVYTRDLNRALRVSEALEAGLVGVNRGVVSDAAAPFGGLKQSGLGREGGHEGIEEYVETKYIALTNP